LKLYHERESGKLYKFEREMKHETCRFISRNPRQNQSRSLGSN
jgi:hypothetical protein